MNNETIDKPVVTAELIKANFNLELSKLKYQDALQSLASYEVTRDNVVDAQEKIKGARSFLKKFDEIKTAGKAAALAECRMWDDAFNQLRDPFDKLLMEKSSKMSKIAQELDAERMVAEKEKFRVNGIKQSIDSFFIEQSQTIANAKTPQELVRIEQLIGSHKGNHARYAEFLPDLVAKASNLTELIKIQKEALRKLEALKEAENAAHESGDDQKVLDAREAQEREEAKISEQKVKAQEEAIKMATTSNNGYAEVITPDAPKARRSVWVWDVSNIKETAKKMPDWVQLNINVPKVDEYLKAKKAEGIEGEEFTFAGIRFFISKSY